MANVPLNEAQADALLVQMEANAEVAYEVKFTLENWYSEFGENGEVNTPIGIVKMGENQLSKLLLKKRTHELGMIKPTLTNPHIILEEEAIEDCAERQTMYVFIKTFLKKERQTKYYASITVRKDGIEVSISSHYMERKAVRKKINKYKLLYMKKALFSISSDGHLAEQQDAVPDLLPSQENDASSRSKNSKNTKNTSNQA